MDTKKLILAIALSVVVITIYQLFFLPKPQPMPKSQPQQQQQAEETAPAPAGESGSQEKSPVVNDISDYTVKEEPKTQAGDLLEAVTETLKGDFEKDITVETDLYTAVFTNKGAGLKSFVLKHYQDDEKQPLDLVSRKVEKAGIYPFYFSTFEGVGEYRATYKKANNEPFFYQGDPVVRFSGEGGGEIVFKLKDPVDNLSVTKKFTFSGNSYVVGVECEVIAGGKVIRDVPVVFGPDLENNIKKERMGANLLVGVFTGEKVRTQDFLKVKTQRAHAQSKVETGFGALEGTSFWAVYERAYFAVLMKSSRSGAPVMYQVIKERIDKENLELYSYMIVTDPQKVYLGPKDEEVLEMVEPDFGGATEVIEYGLLAPISKLMLKGINLIHGFVPNYGWALVIFTLLLKLLLFPLTYTSSVSMAKMQTLQPKIKAIKKKYKNLRDPEQRRKMNVETMELYKKEKVNPAGGCLPMLLQLPILFAVFYLLRTSINVRHEAWIFWIQDLSLKDPIYLLPILMGVSQIVLQKFSPTSAEGAQQKMMYIMPIVITFIVMSLPSGLNLYWFVSNLLQIGQQQIINKKIYSEKREQDKKQKELKRKKGVKNK